MSNLPQISEAEFEVMKIVWKYAPISTNEITEKLTQTSSWSPKTIQTLIKRLVSNLRKTRPGFCLYPIGQGRRIYSAGK